MENIQVKTLNGEENFLVVACTFAYLQRDISLYCCH